MFICRPQKKYYHLFKCRFQLAKVKKNIKLKKIYNQLRGEKFIVQESEGK